MALYVTEIIAKCPHTDALKRWCGPNVPGVSFDTAQQYCDQNGLGYCKVIGKLVAEIPTKNGCNFEADFSKKIDHENPSLN